MSSFLHLNMQDSNSYALVCICCASQSPVLINMSTCKHTDFLTNYLNLELELKKMYICNLCHNMLKKIEIFKQQVEDSVALLLNQAPILKINKLHNMQIAPIKSFTHLTIIEVEKDIKIEPVTDNISDTEEVKNEIESSDNDTEVPLSVLQTNKNKRKRDMRYEGKIKTVYLTEDDLRIEREKMAADEKYLKLPYKCELCILAFDHELTLQNHNEGRHKKDEDGFECNVCKSTLSTKVTFKEHVQRHYRRLECMVCQKRYNHMSSALQHYTEQHAGDTNTLFSCNKCEFTASTRRAYRYHLDKHKKKPSCSICGNQFVNSNGLKVHMYTIQDNRFPLLTLGLSPVSFICDECGAKFLTKSSLQVHINWEHLKIGHKCTQCTKVFKNSYTLDRHVSYVHNKLRPPRNKICDYCGRGFTTQTILKSHIRTHTGERPLQCTHCTATFAHPAALYTHNKLLHSGNK
ncbi:zinc finger protein 883-like [Spodoptera litura]|uniref:Zinc finger protein 883-like n=1 Tax=Spodoptera litura TaxID=69820 RepID=A0A9J7ETK5_SPOLT|nr:zinc finger protein 883-like [Spodoptera litura]